MWTSVCPLLVEGIAVLFIVGIDKSVLTGLYICPTTKLSGSGKFLLALVEFLENRGLGFLRLLSYV